MPLGAANLNLLSRYVPSESIPSNLDAIDLRQDESPTAYYTDTTITPTSLSASRYCTLSMWLSAYETQDTFNRLLDIRTGSTSTTDWMVNIAATNQLQFVMTITNQRNRIRSTQTTGLWDGSWHHMLVVFDNENSANCKMYIDGTEEGSSILVNSTYDFAYDSIQGIGVGDDIASFTNGWDGKVAQIWMDNSYQDDITKFYDTTNNKAKWLGTDGTATGLSQPLIFHYGDTSNFPTNNGRSSGSYLSGYTLASAGGTINDTTGPAVGS